MRNFVFTWIGIISNHISMRQDKINSRNPTSDPRPINDPRPSNVHILHVVHLSYCMR